jgi:hypothetical protein
MIALLIFEKLSSNSCVQVEQKRTHTYAYSTINTISRSRHPDPTQDLALLVR